MSTTTVDPLPLAETLRHARLAQGRTLRQVAAAAGISPMYLCDLERGRRVPPVATVERLASALRLDPTDLLWRWVRQQVGATWAAALAEYVAIWGLDSADACLVKEVRG